MTEHAVVIAGGGPTGLMLAARAGAGGDRRRHRRAPRRPGGRRFPGRRPARPHARGARPAGHRRTLPRRGPAAPVRRVRRDRAGRHRPPDPPPPACSPSGRAGLERILADWVVELGVPILRGPRGGGHRPGRRRRRGRRCPTARPCAPTTSSAATGAQHSCARRPASTSPGWDARRARPDRRGRVDEPVVGMRPEGGGIGPVDPERTEAARPGGAPERRSSPDREPTLAGPPGGARRAPTAPTSALDSPTWISRFTDMTRQAASYRRVGCSSPATLRTCTPAGWPGPQRRRAGRGEPRAGSWPRWCAGTSPQSLLDTYHAERHPVGARVLQNTMAQVALATGRRPPPGPARTACSSCWPWTSPAGASPG